ncbi:MAG: hypothetical protein IPH68_14945 [Chitinophagaceae bacterium]|nr:hypothetical protein [Chitinophagaceae bacterium]
MIAYNRTWLDNLAARDAIKDAFYANAVSAAEKEAAETIFPVGFYSPNIFIRIGLFILTVVIACFSLGLFSLIFLDSIERSIGGLTIFFGLLSYGALEFFIHTKHHYRSGVDDALLWITGICIIAGINLLSDISSSGNALIIFVLATYFFLRFTDMLMSAIAGLALLAVVFFYYSPLGSTAKATTPFLLMGIAAFMYFFIKKTVHQNSNRHYRHCGTVLEITMLICFYAAANYYVVREMSNSMFNLGLKENESIPFGWLFWIFTILIPLVYILGGVQKKDAVLLRVGLIAVAAIVFTVRYYHTVLPVEIVMLLGGIILITVSYALTKWLVQPKNGFTSAEISKRYIIDKMNIEALVIAETFGSNLPANDSKFGGGSFGGGGASGEY